MKRMRHCWSESLGLNEGNMFYTINNSSKFNNRDVLRKYMHTLKGEMKGGG